MRVRTLLSLVTLVVFAQLSWAQVASDPQDSGYTSPYLKNFGRSALDLTDPDADNAFLREEANKQRFGTNPQLVGDLINEAAKQRALFPQLMPGALSTGGAPQWVSIGPTKTRRIQNGVLLTKVNSGRIRTILPHPTNPNIMYVLTSSGGLWKTTDFTSKQPHWRSLTDSLLITSGGGVAFGATPEILYLGLGDFFENSSAAGAYMLKSTDGGETWSAPIRMTAFGVNAASIRDVKVDVGTSGQPDVILVATDFGLFRSADSGATYTRVGSGVFLYPTPIGTFSQTVWSIQQGRQAANGPLRWVASIESPFAGFAGDGFGALVVSTDRGATWSPLATFQAALKTFDDDGNPIRDANGNFVTVTRSAGRITLGVGTPGDNVLYAYAADQGDNRQLDLFRSSDGGTTWAGSNLEFKTPVNPNPSNPDMNIMRNQAFYNHMLLVNPLDTSRNTVYIGGQLGSAVSTNGGNTWTILAEWLGRFTMPYVHADYHAAAFSTLNNTIFFGTDGGVFTSQDNGKSWDDTKNEGIVTTLAYSLATSPRYPAISLFGTQDNGTYVREFPGKTTVWNQIAGGDGVGTAWSQANDDVTLGSFPGTFVFRSLTNPPKIQGQLRVANTGINRRFGTFFTSFATPAVTADPTGHVFYTYTPVQIYKTTNGAASWQEIGRTFVPGDPDADPPIPDIQACCGINPARIFRDTPHGIGVSPVAGGTNHVGVACLSGFVVFTHNGGANWFQTALIGTVAGWGGFNSTVEFADNDTIYVGSENPAPGARVAKSTDGGVSFTRSDTGLPNVPVIRLLVSPADKNTIYAATYLGVYRSTNAAASWERFGAGLPMVEVDDINIIDGGKTLRAATFGRGIWEISLQ